MVKKEKKTCLRVKYKKPVSELKKKTCLRVKKNCLKMKLKNFLCSHPSHSDGFLQYKKIIDILFFFQFTILYLIKLAITTFTLEF